MINYIRPIDETPACGYGVLLEEGQFLCRECRARDRWTRPQEARRRTTRRREETRHPRSITRAG